MALGILADVNIKRQFQVLVSMLSQEPWKGFWEYTCLKALYFEDVGLSVDAIDSRLWEVCQIQNLVLITANRNASGPDSLEETIRTKNKIDSLPVITLSNAQRFLQDKTYASKVAEKTLDILFDIEAFRGTGRLYVP